MVRGEARKNTLVSGCKESWMSHKGAGIFFFPICNKGPLQIFKLMSGVGGKVCATTSSAFLNEHSNSDEEHSSTNFSL